MNRIALSAAAVLIAIMGAASAQKPEDHGDANKALTDTNCPPAGSGQTTGAAPRDPKAVEKSAIVPNAGGSEESAAPTVQRNGQAIVADCPSEATPPKPKG